MPGIRRWLEELIFVIVLVLALINLVLAGIFSSSLGQPAASPILAESTPGRDSLPAIATSSVKETATPQVLEATGEPVAQILPSPLAVTPARHTVLPGLPTPMARRVTSASRPDGLTPTRLLIPSIALDAPVEAVGWHVETQAGVQAKVWDAPLYFAAGWLNSSAPVGRPGNTVLDGHHNIHGEVFKNLVNLNVGDTITLYAGDRSRDYRVDQKLILEEAGQPLEVRQANARYIQPTDDERLTLVTCWPDTGNSHRLIIIAFPIQP